MESFGIIKEFSDSFEDVIDPSLKSDNFKLPKLNDPLFDFNPTEAQRFIIDELSPEKNDFPRVVLNASPGFGKTFVLASLAVIYAQYLKTPLYESGERCLMVLTFNQTVFFKEFIKRPTLNDETEKIYRSISGLIEKYEKEKNPVQKDHLEIQINHLMKLLHRQLFSPQRNCLSIIVRGYQQFVFKLFKISDVKSLINISKDGPLSEFSKRIDAAEKKGILKVDHELIESIKGSILICDEFVHFGASELNSRGLAILYCLQKCPKIRFIVTDGTIIQSFPHEILTLFSLCFPSEDFAFEDYFTEDYEIKQEKVPEIIQRSSQCIFSFPNLNTNTPMLICLAEPLKIFKTNEDKSITAIEYPWMVWPVYLTKEQTRLYIEHDLNPLSAQSIHKNILIKKEDEIFTELSRYHSFPSEYAPKKFNILTGENLRHYAPKGHSMLNLLHSFFFGQKKKRSGKVLILTNDVIEGVNFIASVLLSNGYIERGSLANPETLCSICHQRQIEHDEAHKFLPMTFISAHTYMNQIVSLETLLNIFNHPDNNSGNYIKILIGGTILLYGHNIPGVVLVILHSCWSSISRSIQGISRTLRPDALIDNEQNFVVCVDFVTYLNPDVAQKLNFLNTREQIALSEKINMTKKNTKVRRLITEKNPLGILLQKTNRFSPLRFTEEQKKETWPRLLKEMQEFFIPTLGTAEANNENFTTSFLVQIVNNRIGTLMTLVLHAIRYIMSYSYSLNFPHCKIG